LAKTNQRYQIGVTDRGYRSGLPIGVTDWRYQLALPTGATNWHQWPLPVSPPEADL